MYKLIGPQWRKSRRHLYHHSVYIRFDWSCLYLEVHKTNYGNRSIGYQIFTNVQILIPEIHFLRPVWLSVACWLFGLSKKLTFITFLQFHIFQSKICSISDCTSKFEIGHFQLRDTKMIFQHKRDHHKSVAGYYWREYKQDSSEHQWTGGNTDEPSLWSSMNSLKWAVFWR